MLNIRSCSLPPTTLPPDEPTPDVTPQKIPPQPQPNLNPVPVHPIVTHGTLSRYKACIVANGSTLLSSIDVDEIFSLVVKPTTIQIVLSLATSRHWPVHQLDEFSMMDLGSVNYFLGISVVRDSLGMFLSQRIYVAEILERAHMVHCNPIRCNPSRTPVDTESKMGDDGCPTTQRSTSGYCEFLGNNLVSWSSKHQQTLSRSSAKAEYRSVANDVAEICWLRNLLRELHTSLPSVTLVYYKNVSVVYLLSNPVQHQRMKHIAIDIHFVRNFIAVGQLERAVSSHSNCEGSVSRHISLLGSSPLLEYSVGATLTGISFMFQ
ncbi:ribonuclease H-like domain-containing protein [Tanacetum coccineum]